MKQGLVCVRSHSSIHSIEQVLDLVPYSGLITPILPSELPLRLVATGALIQFFVPLNHLPQSRLLRCGQKDVLGGRDGSPSPPRGTETVPARELVEFNNHRSKGWVVLIKSVNVDLIPSATFLSFPS